MKKLLVLAFTVFFTQWALAQEQKASLEKGLASVDIGFLGSWLTYERQVGDQLTLNTQLGLEGGFFGGGGEFNYAFTPTVSVEPRFYYNFSKRVAKQKKTINNSANYLTITGTYIPGLFTVTDDDVEAEAAFNLIPKWGVRRTLGKQFKFDFAVGYGVAFRQNETAGQLGLDLKIGYIFYKK